MKHLILLTLALVSRAPAADKPAHLFILSGQSNMTGMNPKLGFEPEAQKLFSDAEVAYIKVAVDADEVLICLQEGENVNTSDGMLVDGQARLNQSLAASK